VAGSLGYCGLDRRRTPLTGDELRGCWSAAPFDNRPPDSAPWASRVIDPSSGGRRSRVDFVPIGELETGAWRQAGELGSRPGPAVPPPATTDAGSPFRWVLWEDAEI